MENPKHVNTVVVVDDDEMVRTTLEAFILYMGYKVLVARDGREALRLLESRSIDLVLSDLVMPEMDGLELLEFIKANYPETGVIIATGYSDRESYADVIRAGAMDFIKKPIDHAELEAKLARAFRERNMVRLLEQQSLSDGLTDLLNRRAFDQKFPLEVERANRQGYQLFLAFVDIDDFKEYNNTHGHHQGDEVLVTLARVFNECTRTNVDLSFRLGGDEFAVLLPQTTAAQAKGIVNRVLHRFREYMSGATTLSIGLVSCRRDSTISTEKDERDMRLRADQAMYDAKNEGKDRVVLGKVD
ncbi:MAG: GGDEF domain-containing protein [Desulfopila sp.]